MSSATQQCQQNKVKVALFIPVGIFGSQGKKRAFTHLAYTVKKKGHNKNTEDKTDTQTKITEVLSTSESATKLCTTSGAATIY